VKPDLLRRSGAEGGSTTKGARERALESGKAAAKKEQAPAKPMQPAPAGLPQLPPELLTAPRQDPPESETPPIDESPSGSSGVDLPSAVSPPAAPPLSAPEGTGALGSALGGGEG
jgi:hypothetical protein